jgi:hypothetical protein
VASIIERINFDCPINLMLAIISLTAPIKRLIGFGTRRVWCKMRHLFQF